MTSSSAEGLATSQPENQGADAAKRGRPATPALVLQPTVAERVAVAIDGWRSTLVSLAGGSTLADVTLLGDAVLDLTAAHPSGIAQLFAGRSTRLSNIFREKSALPVARRRARSVAQRSQEQAERYGIAPTYLAIGLATWTEGGADDVPDDVSALARVTVRTTFGGSDDSAAAGAKRKGRIVRAPVLLRPVSIVARGGADSDFELGLEPTAEINPVLARALRSRGALLDPTALARGAFTGSGFDPAVVLDRIDALGSAVLADFALTDKLLVGTFAHPGQMLVDDLDDLIVGLDQHEVIAALAGDPAAIDSLRVPLPEALTGDAEPTMERGVGDLDPAGRAVLEALATGSHLFVDAPVGSDSTGVIAAVVAEASAIGRSVLYVPGHRRAADALTERLDELGLGDLVLDVTPSPSWRTVVSRRLLGAMTLEAPYIDAERIADTRLDLVETRLRLTGLIDGLHRVREPWGISAYDALQALARLTSARPTPSTTVRLDSDVLARIAQTRPELGADLVRAANLEAFVPRSTASHWYGADLDTEAAAADALARINRLLDTTLADLRTQLDAVAESTGLQAPRTLAQWGEQLTMLAGMRSTLDVFQPLVFERTADDLVAATASHQWRIANDIEMTGLHRRRLVKRAKDMLRPGTRVDDLHAALLNVQAERRVWAEHCPGGGWPRLPEGLANMEQTYRDTLADLALLDPVLATTTGGGNLADLPFAELTERLQRLAGDAEALTTLPERTRLLRGLATVGLGPLVADFTVRRVPVGLVESELDLAWWSSVFEQIIAADPQVAEVGGRGIELLAETFRRLDRAHVDSLAVPIQAATVAQIHGALRDHREQAEGLFAELVEESVTSLRTAFDDYADVLRKLRPCMIATPTLVPHLLPAHRIVDLVILDAAQHLPIESVLSAIARGRQLVVVGDARCAPGKAVRTLARLLPTVALTGESSRRDPELTQLLMRHGYQNVLRPMPLPSFERLVTFDLVEGAGMPAAGSGAVESTQAEVDRVVELAILHALDRPDESLAIIAGSASHADRIREEILGQVRHNAALVPFFSADRREPVVIADLQSVAGLSRDAVIFSLGYGRTPHGRVLHNFGMISGSTGEALLLNAIGATRRRIGVVACFRARDLDPERLRGAGSRLLGELLEFAESRAATTDLQVQVDIEGQPEPDRLVLDLAERLWRTGLTVETHHGSPGGEFLPLVVGHPALPGEMLVAVLTDDESYTAERSIRVRDRQRAERLERLGWHVVQVWSVSLFLDPEGQANRIREVVLDIEESRRAARAAVASTRALPHLDGTSVLDGAIFDAQNSDAGQLVDPSAPVPVVTEAMLTDLSAPADNPGLALRKGPVRGNRPAIQVGLPISAYGDNELDELVAWVAADEVERDADQLAEALRAELGITRRSQRVDIALASAISRLLGE